MIRIRQAVIVEGKYDKIKLSGLLDTLILTTDGFGIFKDREKLELIRSLAKTRGIVILTDSDSAGFLIRNHLRGAVREGEILHAYIPEIRGREKRKARDSADGLLGVEGVDEETVLRALADAGVTADRRERRAEPVTKADLYRDGFCGVPDAAEKRKALCRLLDLPTRLSANLLPQVISDLCGKDEYRAAVERVMDEFVTKSENFT